MSIPSWAAIDVNERATLTAVSSVDDKTVVRLVADPTTGALLVSASSGGNSFVYNEIVSGSGTSWTLAHTPQAGLYAIYGAGQRLTPGAGNDFTISGATITTANSFNAGEILADYQF